MDKAFITENYNQAVITCLWTVFKGYRQLMFGMVEFTPAFLGDEVSSEEYGVNFAGRRLYYKRYRSDTESGYTWYESACRDGFVTMLWQNDEAIYMKAENEESARLTRSPRGANTLYSDFEPFRSHLSDGAQVSHLMAINRVENLEKFIADEAVADWIEKHLHWKLNLNLEFLGSVNAVFPNPYYCHSYMRLLPASSNKDPDSLKLCFDRDCSGRKLFVIIQEKVNGELGPRRRFLLNSGDHTIPLMGFGDMVAYSIVDEAGMIWERQDFTGFLRKIITDLNVVERTCEIRCKDGAMQSIQTTVTDRQVCTEAEKDNLEEMQLHNKTVEMVYARWQRESAKDQMLFYGEEGRAERMIRSLINTAKKDLLIIDPYFSHETADLYFCGINRGVKVRVLCGKKGLKDGGNGRELQERISELQNLGSEVTVKVAGHAYLHDRFVVVDDENVWLLGSSLKSLGGSLSAVVRLNNGREVARSLKKLFDEVSGVDLGDWVKLSPDDERRCWSWVSLCSAPFKMLKGMLRGLWRLGQRC